MMPDRYLKISRILILSALVVQSPWLSQCVFAAVNLRHLFSVPDLFSFYLKNLLGNE